MRVILLFCIFVFLMLAPAAAQRAPDTAQYIGLRHGPALPTGLQQVGGSLVSAIGDEKEYVMTEVHKGATRMLWFERLTHRDEKGVAYSEVRDVMSIPRLPKKQLFVYAFCLLNNKPDGEIAAVVDKDDAQYFTRVRRAWRANRQTEKFEAISNKGIKCENVGFGM